MLISYNSIAVLDKLSTQVLVVALDKAREEGFDPCDYYLYLAEGRDEIGEVYFAVTFSANEITGEFRGSPSEEGDPPSFTVYIKKSDKSFVKWSYSI
ncbi:hypothetical protein [Zophobihabitans entericus]|uniref:Uncharacterized protein n=1 Tax=Zophobihabitans entericus TaxID=1635327 RepID=A0A6G9IB39_9GAMM|nr:hypothetical protein [Zophobihabitans entericus]QIQ21441.1 hypothetical protein IPMB12_06935 [Zophobihabitans entericus]